MMLWSKLATFLSLLATSNTINRQVLKIILHQKGFAQFVQYDVETPPLREFTLCTWIRLYDFVGDQSIFTYVGSGSTRYVRLWLDSGGQQMKVSINERVTSSAAVQLAVNTWHHVCLSYQADYGAWAIYIDSRLLFCESSQQLLGFVIPGGGSLIVGYGISENGSQNGLEGEIYGASMILFSTIERNYTLKQDPRYKQKQFRKNQVKGRIRQDNIYVVLGDLQTEEIRDYLHETSIPLFNKTQSYMRFSTPYSFNEDDVSSSVSTTNPKILSSSTEKEILNIPVTDNLKLSEINGKSFWNLVTNAAKLKENYNNELSESGRPDLPTVFEYETPPSVSALKSDYSEKGIDVQKDHGMVQFKNNMFNNQFDIISAVEKPPPPEDKSKVYGQWTSSKFVGNVLKYLKSIRFNKHKGPRKVLSTFPLVKLTDSFPYPSEFKLLKLLPPPQFKTRNFTQCRIKKRDTNHPQINLQIIKNDSRSDILKLYSNIKPRHVDVTSRGETRENVKIKFFKSAENNKESLESRETSDISSSLLKDLPFTAASNFNNQNALSNFARHRGSNLMTVLPFLKTVGNFMDNSNNNMTKIIKGDPVYSKGFKNGNKWHNVESLNNDYTPRRLDLESDGKSVVEAKVAEANKRYPSIRIKYKHDDRKLVQSNDNEVIIKGRMLAEEVSNQANEKEDSISVLKYNHGFLPGHEKRMKISDKVGSLLEIHAKQNKMSSKNNFNKNVKLGNALSEQHIVGFYESQSRRSFVGGDDKIPDINKYRSEWDKENENVPSSLGPRVCKKIELYDRVLYVQPDESIDMNHILSPVREKNLGIEFILESYKKCSMLDSTLQYSPYLLIDWSKTPVRLFGGAYPQRTKDLCGFF